MKILIAALLITFTGVINSQSKQTMKDVQNIIKETQHNYAPDKRTAVFDVEYKAEGNKLLLKGETDMEKAKKQLTHELKKSGYENIVDEIEVLPSKKLGDNTSGVVDLSVASLRTHPKNAAEMATQALLGSTLKVLKKSPRGGWYLVQTPDKYIAWIPGGDFALMNKGQLDQWNLSAKVIFLDNYGFAYSGKDTKSTPVSDLVAGNILKKIGEDGDFVKVEYPDKRTGYVKTKSVLDYDVWLKSREINAPNILSTAKRFMGVPYLWGGTSTKAMDCSGFTKTVYYLNGVLLPRDASQQVHVGIPIDTKNGFENLKPGDLLFFGKKATDSTKEKITHVGIYLGNDEFIHEAGRVKINSFNKNAPNFNAYRLHQFVRAKRVLTSIDKNGVIKLSKKDNYTP